MNSLFPIFVLGVVVHGASIKQEQRLPKNIFNEKHHGNQDVADAPESSDNGKDEFQELADLPEFSGMWTTANATNIAANAKTETANTTTAIKRGCFEDAPKIFDIREDKSGEAAGPETCAHACKKSKQCQFWIFRDRTGDDRNWDCCLGYLRRDLGNVWAVGHNPNFG